MIDDGVSELELEDLAPVGRTKHVAALAFVSDAAADGRIVTESITKHNCLSKPNNLSLPPKLTITALTTKGILSVSQPEPWGFINLSFTVQV